MEASAKWNSAAINGLLLSLVTIVYSLIQSVFGLSGFSSIILWMVKFAGCIYLLYYFMKQYSGNFEQISYGSSFQYGFILCSLSSIVCACFSFISMTLLFPETTELAIEQMQTVMASGNYSSEEENIINSMADNLPQITLFAGLFYYIVIGAVMSSIIANFTKKTDPFAEYDKNGSDAE